MRFPHSEFNFSHGSENPTSIPVKTLLEEYADGRRHFHNLDLRDGDLAHAKLTMISLEESILQRANLSHANLAGATLNHVDLTSANLTQTNLIAADLVRAKLIDANLTGAILSGANLSGASLRKANLTHCIFAGTNLSGVDFSGSILSNVVLGGANLRGANLSNVDLSDVDLSDVDLTETILPESLAGQRWLSENRDFSANFGGSVPGWEYPGGGDTTADEPVQDDHNSQTSDQGLYLKAGDAQDYEYAAEEETNPFLVESVSQNYLDEEASISAGASPSTQSGFSPEIDLSSSKVGSDFSLVEYANPEPSHGGEDIATDHDLDGSGDPYAEEEVDAELYDEALYRDALEAIDAIAMGEADVHGDQDDHQAQHPQAEVFFGTPDLLENTEPIDPENLAIEPLDEATLPLFPLGASMDDAPTFHRIASDNGLNLTDSNAPWSTASDHHAPLEAEDLTAAAFVAPDATDPFHESSLTAVDSPVDALAEYPSIVPLDTEVASPPLSEEETLFLGFQDTKARVDDPAAAAVDGDALSGAENPFSLASPEMPTVESPSSQDYLAQDYQDQSFLGYQGLEARPQATSDFLADEVVGIEIAGADVMEAEATEEEETCFVLPEDSAVDPAGGAAPLSGDVAAAGESVVNLAPIANPSTTPIADPSTTPSANPIATPSAEQTEATPTAPNASPTAPSTFAAAKATPAMNTRVVQSIQAALGRRVQYSLQRKVLDLYHGRCAITGCDVQPLLDIALVASQDHHRDDHPSQCLVLRSDLKTLYDLKLLAIHPETYRVLLAPSLLDSDYGPLQGRPITMPDQKIYQPRVEGLTQQLQACRWYDADYQNRPPSPEQPLVPGATSAAPTAAAGRTWPILPIVATLGLGSVALIGLVVGIWRYPLIAKTGDAPSASPPAQVSSDLAHRINLRVGEVRYNQQGVLMDQKAYVALESAQRWGLVEEDVPREYQRPYQGQPYVSLAYLADSGTSVEWDAQSRTAILDCCQSMDIDPIQLSVNGRDWPSGGLIVDHRAYVPQAGVAALNGAISDLDLSHSIDYQGNTYLRAGDLKDLAILVEWNPEARVLSISN